MMKLSAAILLTAMVCSVAVADQKYRRAPTGDLGIIALPYGSNYNLGSTLSWTLSPSFTLPNDVLSYSLSIFRRSDPNFAFVVSTHQQFNERTGAFITPDLSVSGYGDDFFLQINAVGATGQRYTFADEDNFSFTQTGSQSTSSTPRSTATTFTYGGGNGQATTNQPGTTDQPGTTTQTSTAPRTTTAPRTSNVDQIATNDPPAEDTTTEGGLGPKTADDFGNKKNDAESAFAAGIFVKLSLILGAAAAVFLQA